VSVPIGVFRKWLAGELRDDDTADVESAAREEADEGEEQIAHTALWWRGPEKCGIVRAGDQIAPDDTYILPCAAPGADAIGDFPLGLTDYAEEAFQHSRDKALLRL